MCTGLTHDGDAENKLSITLLGPDSFLKWIFDHKSTSILKTVFLNLVIFFKSMGFFFFLLLLWQHGYDSFGEKGTEE